MPRETKHLMHLLAIQSDDGAKMSRQCWQNG